MIFLKRNGIQFFQKQWVCQVCCMSSRGQVAWSWAFSFKVSILFIGSDLSVCVTDALLQPIRELEHATHWRPQSNSSDSLLYTPCKKEDEGSIEHRLLDLPPFQVRMLCSWMVWLKWLTQVYPRKISASDLIDSIDRCGQTVKKEDLDKHTKFTDMYGQIG